MENYGIVVNQQEGSLMEKTFRYRTLKMDFLIGNVLDDWGLAGWRVVNVQYVTPRTVNDYWIVLLEQPNEE